MYFTSYGFIAFLAIMFAVYFLAPKKIQWVTLLIGSYVFYAFAGFKYLLVIILTTLSAYVISRILGGALAKENRYIEENKQTLSKEERKAYRARSKKKRLAVLVIGLVINLGVLAVIKYTAFAVSNINGILAIIGREGFTVPSILWTWSMSFYTFQTVGYLIDVYRAKVAPEKNIAKFALFVSFFPQLVQGPISRFSELGDQLTTPHKFEFKTFTFGLQRVLWGYFKKLVIADRVLAAVTTLIGNAENPPLGGVYVMLLILLYSIQIYTDFTGGIDITIGIAEAMGIKLAENFDRPFSSKSTKEYWRRWHITMGTWFKDYIFTPFSVTSPVMKLNKFLSGKIGRRAASKTVAYTASLLTWFLTGLWHGASWNFIVWGLLNCLVIMVSETLEPLYQKFHDRFPRLTSSWIYGKFMSVRTFLLMGLIRSLDCYRNVGLTFAMWGSMLTFGGIGSLFKGGILDLGLTVADIVIILVGVCVIYVVSNIHARTSVREKLWERPVLSALLCGVLFIVVIMLGAYGNGYEVNPSIYNQF